ncbi:EAL domain-containing protein [Vibrio tritonius]|uniref:EAL domain-containing protein n=1 Tax=Vibrio tritonius TaxID=1435069 RepID=UPI00315D2F95
MQWSFRSLARSFSLFNLAPVSTHLALCFSSLVIYVYFAIAFSNTYFNHVGHQSIDYINNILITTQQQTRFILDNYQDKTCEETIGQLRTATFNSNYAKEIGIFDPKGVIFCTNNNNEADIKLFRSITERLNNAPNHETLSFTRGALTREYTILYLFTNQERYGLSISIPPRYLVRDIQMRLLPHNLNFAMFINKHKVSSGNNNHNILRQMMFESKLFPVQVELHLSFYTYAHYLFTYSWLFLVLYLIILINHLHKRRLNAEKLSLEYAVVNAIKNRELNTYFQPIIDTQTELPIGCEALTRWNHPTQGNIPPDVFIPLIQRTGHIRELTELVIEQCILMHQHYPEMMQNKYVSINIDRELLLTESFTQYIGELVLSHPKFSDWFAFEITENGNFSAQELAIVSKNIARLHALKIRLFVDDFGTGYSGLDFVRQFAFHTMKIDKVFIKNLGHEPHLTMLLESMLQISDSLNMKAIVEGVETHEQLMILKQMRVSYIQGFYFSKALPADDLIAYFNERHAQPLIPLNTSGC